jgi:hypothetical protein
VLHRFSKVLFSGVGRVGLSTVPPLLIDSFCMPHQVTWYASLAAKDNTGRGGGVLCLVAKPNEHHDPAASTPTVL